jgi:hypothetical protein
LETVEDGCFSGVIEAEDQDADFLGLDGETMRGTFSGQTRLNRRENVPPGN